MKGLNILLGLALSAGAAQAAEATEDVFLADMPMVLTASRIAQSALDAAAPVTVIDRETIRASGFTEIRDLFRLVPGFLVADWPGGSPVVVNHGLGDALARRMQVLID